MSGTLENSAQIVPAEHAYRITPSDVNDLIAPTRGIYVGIAGNLRVRMVDGSDETFENLAAGIIHPMRVIRVFATGTAATGIRGLR